MADDTPSWATETDDNPFEASNPMDTAPAAGAPAAPAPAPAAAPPAAEEPSWMSASAAPAAAPAAGAATKEAPAAAKKPAASSWSDPNAAAQNYAVQAATNQARRGAADKYDSCSKLPREVVAMRVMNVLIVGLMSWAATNKMQEATEIAAYIVAFYVYCFALLLCCYETHITTLAEIIARNFGFLYNWKGRMVFLLLVAFLCISLDSCGGESCGVAGRIAAVFIVINTLFTTFVVFRHPVYEQEIRAHDLGLPR